MYSLEHAYLSNLSIYTWKVNIIIHHTLFAYQNDGLNNKPNQPLTLILITQISAIYLQFMDAYLICKNIFLQYETPTH